MIRSLYFFSSIALFAVLLPLSGFAQTALSSLNLSEAQISQLRKEGQISFSGKSLSDIRLMPQGALYQGLQADLAKMQIKSTIESIYLLPNLKGAFQLAFYQAFFNISSLKGLQFYSRSEKKMKDLIYDAYFIENATSKKRITHTPPQTLDANWHGVMMQDDETFGAKIYDISMTTSNTEILLKLQNIEKLTQGLVTVAKPKEMLTLFYIIQTDEGLLLYQLITTAQAVPGFVRDKANESLFNRQNAYKTWIENIYPK